ncbi:MAG TPA: hypothetical protein VNL91_06280, partial [Thermoanaerobaculia bacterium]|nr:hypothetical protein [Thermoanaerobaculia bacterium]
GITAAAAAAAVTASPTVNLLTTGATPLVGAGLGPGSVPVVGVPVVAAAPAQAASPQISQPLTASGRVRAVTATAAGAGLGATAPPAVAARNRSVRISNTNGMVIISNAGGAESAAFTQRVRATRKP